MKKLNVEIGDIIRIGDNFLGIKAEVKNIFDEKSNDYCGVDILVVYNKKDGINGVKKEVVWKNDNWEFKNESPSGSYVDINNYPKLK